MYVEVAPASVDVIPRQSANHQRSRNGTETSRNVHTRLRHCKGVTSVLKWWCLNMLHRRLTRPPFPRQNLTRHTVSKRNRGEAKSDKDLGDNQPVHVARPRSNGGANERDNGRAHEQSLAGLKGIRGGGDDGAKHRLNQRQ